MANKTIPTRADVLAFIDASADTEQKRQDSFRLLEIMESVSGHKPVIWGTSIIGFGTYHYRYASGHEGDAPLIGFSPRKNAFSLYVFSGLEEHRHLLDGLGKFKMGKACIYVKKLGDIDLDVLKDLMKTTINFLQTRYPNTN